MSTRRAQSAFTLVEVLVAIIVLAVGLLGLAGLQLAGMRNNHSSALRSTATIAVADLVDRMRVNPSLFAGKTLTAASGDGETSTAVDPFNSWADALRDLLPAPSAIQDSKVTVLPRGALDCTTVNACGADHCAVSVRWDDSRVEEDLQQDSAGDRVTANMTFRVCVRLPGSI